ncbi:MAG TPA: alpha-glucosidase C-terminal domain-containing protein [Fimbriimonadaceae bacterium]|nr:alpha-glucosidase C-terminal domain-containing protein [Fimbriimonadaceae bacterium]
MVTGIALGLLLAIGLRAPVASHTPGPDDTVRFNRDEFGLRLHTESPLSDRACLLFPSKNGVIRSAQLLTTDGKTYIGRMPAATSLRYAFWLGDSTYKPGTTGSFCDAKGVRTADVPVWYEQASASYPEIKPPRWPSEGAVLYALDSDRFGDGSLQEKGAQGFTKHVDYLQSLGVNGVWLTELHQDAGDVIEDVHRLDWHVVAESDAPPRDVDGVVSSNPAGGKGWRLRAGASGAQALTGNGVWDLRWSDSITGLVRDASTAPSQWAAEMNAIRAGYPDTVSDQMVTRIGGDNRPRPWTLLKGDKARLQQLWLLVMSLPGVPVIDAGDEVGLREADGRMDWDPTHQDSTTLDMVKRLIQMRVTRPSIYRGTFRTLDLGDDNHIFAFERTDRAEATLVLLNSSDDAQNVRVPVAQYGSANLRTLFGNLPFSVAGTTISVSIPPRGCLAIGN